MINKIKLSNIWKKYVVEYVLSQLIILTDISSGFLEGLIGLEPMVRLYNSVEQEIQTDISENVNDKQNFKLNDNISDGGIYNESSEMDYLNKNEYIQTDDNSINYTNQSLRESEFNSDSPDLINIKTESDNMRDSNNIEQPVLLKSENNIYDNINDSMNDSIYNKIDDSVREFITDNTAISEKKGSIGTKINANSTTGNLIDEINDYFKGEISQVDDISDLTEKKSVKTSTRRKIVRNNKNQSDNESTIFVKKTNTSEKIKMDKKRKNIIDEETSISIGDENTETIDSDTDSKVNKFVESPKRKKRIKVGKPKSNNVSSKMSLDG
jgi:hypothetical protein